MSVQNRVLFSLLFALTFFYTALNRNWYNIAAIFQLALVLTLLLTFSVNIKHVKNTLMFWVLLLFFPLLAFFQGQYILNLLAFFFVFELSRIVSRSFFYKASVLYSLIIALVSIMLFSVFRGGGMYNYISFGNQIVPGLNRLLGLDGSPVSISIVVILGILASIQLRTVFYVFIVPFILILVLVWTGSRTTIFAILFALLVAKVKGWKLCVILIFILTLPFLFTYLYVTHSDNLLLTFSIEGVTSYRIVNWVNAIYYYLDSGLWGVLFGIGHLPVLNEAYLAKSFFDGHYTYKFVTYTESAILRIMVNYGLIFFVSFFGLIVYSSKKLESYVGRLTVLIIVLMSFLYDPVYSIQYFFIIMMLFITVSRSRENSFGGL
ncbi:hypothetical protein [Shewanella salipaludis]|uniref:Uncharacterized protein n=1 Tax=Shewanella salipaludis TaxID=2723052 RepID=A0A972JLM2_9GAMM|nr:hypothetical protein [Shewanella salipaludis]NMH65602.1 hypothetical protein [Shewanella salipaludis]